LFVLFLRLQSSDCSRQFEPTLTMRGVAQIAQIGRVEGTDNCLANTDSFTHHANT
jgi:hypothetical protein